MQPFCVRVEQYMQSHPTTVHAEDRIHLAAQRLQTAAYSGLVVVDDAGHPVGVISRNDLLRLETVPAVTGGVGRKLMLPDHTVSQVMTRHVSSVSPQCTLEDAARLMADQQIRRVVVMDDNRLVGLVSTWDLVRRAADARVTVPVRDLMRPCTTTVPPSTPVSRVLAVVRDGVQHGVVVVHDGWPVGVFSESEALRAELQPDHPLVESWASAAFVTLPVTMPCHHAAAQALATGARHTVLVDDGQLVGLLTPSDYIRLAC